jgi:hypothetical protein
MLLLSIQERVHGGKMKNLFSRVAPKERSRSIAPACLVYPFHPVPAFQHKSRPAHLGLAKAVWREQVEWLEEGKRQGSVCIWAWTPACFETMVNNNKCASI